MNATTHANLIDADLEGRVIASLLAHEREAVDLAMSRLDGECFVNTSARALFNAIAAQLREIPADQKIDPNDVVYAAGANDPGPLREFVMQHVGAITGTSIMRMVRADQIASKVDRLIELRTPRVASQQASSILRDVQDGKMEVAEAAGQLTEAASSVDEASRPGSGLHVESADKIAPKAVEWLWPSRIPMGKLTVIAGDPKVGKSVLAVDLTARVSSGARWPDQLTDYNRARKAIVFSAEDDAADTIIPRLIAAEADLSNVLICHGVKNIGGPGDVPFLIGEHLRQLERLIDQTEDVGLITIDPISAFVGSKIDSHNNSDVRGLLAPLWKLAADYGVAVVLITHLNKGAGGKAIYRTMGSLAFTAAARAVWLVTRDKEDPKRILMLNAGMNLARCPGGLAYTIEDRDGLPVLAWESGPVEMGADDALAEQKDGEQKSATEQAQEFIREQLQAGPMPSKDLDAAADAVGIAKRTLARTKVKLGVKAKQQRADGKVAAWIVCLGEWPDQDALGEGGGVVGIVGTVGIVDGKGQERGLPECQGCQGGQGGQGILGGTVGDNGQPAEQGVDRG